MRGTYEKGPKKSVSKCIPYVRMLVLALGQVCSFPREAPMELLVK